MGYPAQSATNLVGTRLMPRLTHLGKEIFAMAIELLRTVESGILKLFSQLFPFVFFLKYFIFLQSLCASKSEHVDVCSSRTSACPGACSDRLI
jgi:hypothetical protein